MANTKSAKKAVQTSERRRRRNQAVRTAAKTAFKKATTALAEGSENARELIREAISTVDKAAAKGIVHRNRANRKKSRLARRLKAAAQNA